MSGYFVVQLQQQMGPKPREDNIVSYFLKHFPIERAKWKNLITMSEFKQSKAGA